MFRSQETKRLITHLYYKLITLDLIYLFILLSVLFLGGCQLIFIGLLGEYIMSINQRVIDRPMVIEEERINFDLIVGD